MTSKAFQNLLMPGTKKTKEQQPEKKLDKQEKRLLVLKKLAAISNEDVALKITEQLNDIISPKTGLQEYEHAAGARKPKAYHASLEDKISEWQTKYAKGGCSPDKIVTEVERKKSNHIEKHMQRTQNQKFQNTQTLPNNSRNAGKTQVSFKTINTPSKAQQSRNASYRIKLTDQGCSKTDLKIPTRMDPTYTFLAKTNPIDRDLLNKVAQSARRQSCQPLNSVTPNKKMVAASVNEVSNLKLPNVFERNVKMSQQQKQNLHLSPVQMARKSNPLLDTDMENLFKTVSQRQNEHFEHKDAYPVTKENFKQHSPFSQWQDALFTGGVFFNPANKGL